MLLSSSKGTAVVQAALWLLQMLERATSAWRTEDEAAKEKYSFGELEEDGKRERQPNVAHRRSALSEPTDLKFFQIFTKMYIKSFKIFFTFCLF